MDIQFLATVPVFSSLHQNDLEEFAKLWTPIHKDKNQILFKKGDAGHTIYLIYQGAVSMNLLTENGEELMLVILQKGDLFGELTMFDNSPRTATAKVLEQTELFEMPRDKFLGFLKTHSDVAIAMLAVLGKRLRDTNQLMEHNVARNANVEMEKKLSFGERMSDKFAEFIGSWTFISIFVLLTISWIIFNSFKILFNPVDPYPFLLATMVLTSLAAMQAPIIMMSQNRQAKKDRLLAEIDYKVNLKSEVWLQELHVKMDEIRTKEIRELITELNDLKQNQSGSLQKHLDKHLETLNRILVDKS